MFVSRRKSKMRPRLDKGTTQGNAVRPGGVSPVSTQRTPGTPILQTERRVKTPHISWDFHQHPKSKLHLAKSPDPLCPHWPTISKEEADAILKIT